jgi:GT2 family glycosyltransferase
VTPDGSQPSVAAVLVNWNGLADTLDCLDSLRASSYSNVLPIVVDNGSTDDSVSVLRERHPEALVIEMGVNAGKAAGDRRGIEEGLRVGVDFVLLLNSDTIVDPEMLGELVGHAMTDRRNGIVGPKMLYADAPTTVWFAGGVVHRLRGDASHIGMKEPDDGRFDTIRPVDYITSCAMLVRAEVFRDIGSIDPDYFIYFDETDFCLRAAAHDWRVVYVPRARLWHKVSSTMGSGSARYWERYSRSRMLFIRKRFPVFRRFVAYGYLVSFDIPRAAVHFLRHGRPRALAAYVGGLVEGLLVRIETSANEQ